MVEDAPVHMQEDFALQSLHGLEELLKPSTCILTGRMKKKEERGYSATLTPTQFFKESLPDFSCYSSTSAM